MTCPKCATVWPIVREDRRYETLLEKAAVAYAMGRPGAVQELEGAAIAQARDLVETAMERGTRIHREVERAVADRNEAVAYLRDHDEGVCGQHLTEEIKRREAAEQKVRDVADRIRDLEAAVRSACEGIRTFARVTDHDEANELADRLVEICDP